MANLSQLCTFSPSLSQLHPRSVAHASGGGAPCLTAGDARAVARVNPWGVQGGLRRQLRRTESVEGVKRCVSRSECCATPPVSEMRFATSPRVRPSGITRGYAWCVPRWGQWVRTGRFLFSLPLHFSTSPLLHFSTSPRVHPSGITRGYAWCVPSGDSGRGLGGFPILSTSPLLHFSTGSSFGHHPRLRMMCPLWGQWAISSPTKKNKLWGGVCILLVAALFVALKNTIRASADAIRM